MNEIEGSEYLMHQHGSSIITCTYLPEFLLGLHKVELLRAMKEENN